MAAPATLTTHNITGKYVGNHELSDPNAVEDMLLVQGFQSWFLRKAIGLATITLSITHKPDELGVERVEVVNSLTGGITTTELSVLDWTSRLHEDHFFGEVLGKSKRVDSPNTIEDSFLKEDWDTSDGVLLFYDESVRESKRWTSEQVWGFAELNGERRHVRRIRITGADMKARYFRLVYDYRKYILVDPARSKLTSHSRTSLKTNSLTAGWIYVTDFR